MWGLAEFQRTGQVPPESVGALQSIYTFEINEGIGLALLQLYFGRQRVMVESASKTSPSLASGFWDSRPSSPSST
ncbi:MAG: hypothetical protein JOY77_06015 [Alphaproteobacteria bacterium]|nr:hypothetical protein [Alphaproteobacteria bacterium]